MHARVVRKGDAHGAVNDVPPRVPVRRRPPHSVLSQRQTLSAVLCDVPVVRQRSGTPSLWFDGQAWDATKFNTALSSAEKFANTFLTLDLLALTPEGNAFVPTAPAAPWLGFSLSYLANFIAAITQLRRERGGGGASATGLLANVLSPRRRRGVGRRVA